MEAAPLWYGITMQEPGISRGLSMKVPENETTESPVEPAEAAARMAQDKRYLSAAADPLDRADPTKFRRALDRAFDAPILGGPRIGLGKGLLRRLAGIAASGGQEHGSESEAGLHRRCLSHAPASGKGAGAKAPAYLGRAR